MIQMFRRVSSKTPVPHYVEFIAWGPQFEELRAKYLDKFRNIVLHPNANGRLAIFEDEAHFLKWGKSNSHYWVQVVTDPDLAMDEGL